MEDVATETYTYATFWQRLGAHFVDAMIIVPIGFLTMWLAPRVGDAWIALWVGMSIVMSLYDPLMHRRYGQTVGKMVAKIQVRQANAQPIEWKHAWRRSSVNLLLAAVSLSLMVASFIAGDIRVSSDTRLWNFRLA